LIAAARRAAVVAAEAADSSDTGESLCPANTRAVSGAYALSNPACQVTLNGPIDETFSGWAVTIDCPAGEPSENNQVVAICIS
jgi:hypothetical protein